MFLRADTRYIAGVDEAGRGALAGPVAAACVVLPPFPALVGVKDSKKIAEKDREVLFDAIVKKAVAIGIAFSSPASIDENNILVATLATMERAVANLGLEPDVILVDGRDRIRCKGRVVAIPGGDGKSLAIAAASVVAKVARDRLMRKLHSKHPAYNFLKNKGYGTKEHVDAIRRLGLLPQHRRSYNVKSIAKSAEML